VPNGGLIRIRTISAGTNVGGAGSGVATIRLVKDTTLGGSPAYAAYSGSTSDSGVTITSGQSIASTDTGGTTITGGNVEYNAVVAVGTSMYADITDLNIYISPGETLTATVASTQSCTIGVSLTWSEDL